ncbi:MAG: hypothetical protein HIU84_02915 [Acidobacteria bacterium]|nr:hypothetical protein [Acidobacteriota bacterium]
MTRDEVLGHVCSCFDALYEVLGSRAPRLTNDAYVVCAYEMGRSFGDVALGLRTLLERDVDPLPVISAVLEHAVLADETGAMALYCVAMVVGPRLLVTMVDARVFLEDDAQALALLDRAGEVCVAQMHRVGAVARNQPPIEDPSWQAAARDLTTTLESSGNAESFGFAH